MRHIMMAAVLAGGSVLPSCGGQGGPEECDSQPAGLYRVTMTEESGNCGPADERIERFGGAPDPNDTSSCMVLYDSMPTSCSSEREMKCTIPGGSGTVRGKYTWTADASRGTGTVWMSIRTDAGATCEGIYRVSLVKL